MITFGSLFAGIGGLDLGLERAGMKCVWQVEKDDYARRVLEKHWPAVRRWDDVRTFPPEGDWGCDLICGGFPCQDISNAGKRAGITGERSGLWSEFARIVRVVRPRFVLMENVAALLRRGIGRVLGDLAACGYDAEWDCLPAAAFGSPVLRDRVFVFASVANGDGRQANPRVSEGPFDHRKPVLFHSPKPSRSGWPSDQPGFLRTVNRVSSGMDRLRCIGNAVVPQVAEWIGRRILEGIGG